MNAPLGASAKVIGSSSAAAIDDPRHGSTPTAEPRKQPTRTHSRFIGVRACVTPSKRDMRASISEATSQNSRRKVESQHHSEGDVDQGRERECQSEVE